MKEPKSAPRAVPNAPMKFKPIPALNNAIAATELARRLEYTETERDHLGRTMMSAAEKMSGPMHDLSALMEMLGNEGNDAARSEVLKAHGVLVEIQRELYRPVPEVPRRVAGD